MRPLLLLPLLLLGGCASLQPADPATMDCPALDNAVSLTQSQLQDARSTYRSPVQLNIGLGGAIGNNGAAGIGFGVPMGVPVQDNARIGLLEQRLQQLQQIRQQRCPSGKP